MNAIAGDLRSVEIKAFVPALAYLHAGDCSFLLQQFYVPEHAGNFMMHLLVADVDAWWRHVESQRLAERYGVRFLPAGDRP